MIHQAYHLVVSGVGFAILQARYLCSLLHSWGIFTDLSFPTFYLRCIASHYVKITWAALAHFSNAQRKTSPIKKILTFFIKFVVDVRNIGWRVQWLYDWDIRWFLPLVWGLLAGIFCLHMQCAYHKYKLLTWCNSKNTKVSCRKSMQNKDIQLQEFFV